MNDLAWTVVFIILILLISPFIVYLLVKMGRYGYLCGNALFDDLQKERSDKAD